MELLSNEAKINKARTGRRKEIPSEAEMGLRLQSAKWD